MKTLGLLICLALLGIGALTLFFWSLLELSFNWQDFLVYLAIAIVVYCVVKVVGHSLNGSFGASVKRFLTGEKSELRYDKGLLRTFGLLLVTMLPFLVYLLLFALYSAITFAVYGLLLISRSPRIPAAILIAFAVVVIGTAIAILIGFYYLFFPPKRRTFGIQVNPTNHQPLWELVRNMTSRLQAKPIDDIIVTPDPGIGVYLGGNVLAAIFGGGRRTLEIGLPSLHGLSVGELGAILAHEYGHFSNRDTQWGSFTYAMGNCLLRALQATPGPPRDEGKQGGGLGQFIVSLNPAFWILAIYTSLFFQVTSGFSRIREVMADLVAIGLYGGQAFGSGLLRVALNDLVFVTAVQQKLVPELLREGQTISDFSRCMDYVYQQTDEPTIEELKALVLSRDESRETYDTHPPVSVRLEYARRFPGYKQADSRPVSALFDDWNSLNEQIAVLYNQRLIAYVNALSAQSVPATASEARG